MEPSQEPRTLPFFWIIVSACAVFLAFVALFYYWLITRTPVPSPIPYDSYSESQNPVIEKTVINELLQYQYRGNFNESAQEAEDVLSGLSATSSIEAQRAITLLANAKIWSSGLENHLEAVRLAKRQLLDEPGSPRNQAFIINRLIGYMTAAMEPPVIEEVFKGEPFAELFDPRSVTDSIFKNLAEESLSRHPTFLAHALVGIWHAEKIFRHHDGHKTLSGEEMREAVAGVKEAIKNMDAIVEEEMKANILYKQTRGAQFNYYQEFLYGALALTDPAYVADMEESFKKVRAEYVNQKNADGDAVALLETRMVYADFAFATYLDAAMGGSRSEDVKKYLQEMIDFMTSHPEAHQGGFLAFIHQTILNGPDGTQGHGRWYSYERFVRMADLHPPFKTFLRVQGWQL